MPYWRLALARRARMSLAPLLLRSRYR